METNILKQIFMEHWQPFVKKYDKRIRPSVLKEVEKFLNCGDPKKGFKLLVCEGCHKTKRIPFRCKGRFCTTCSCGETEEWSRIMSEEVLQVNHRHVIFTIDEGLRDIFRRHRAMLKEFMDEAVRVVQKWFEEKLKVTPGIIAGLHTFGSRLNFNPHVHMLVTMGGMKKNGEWKTYDYIPFEMLRKQWQTVVLKLIRRSLNAKDLKQVQPLLQKAYSANGEGFYVHAPKQKGNVKVQIGYIGRYFRRPAIGLNRIEQYDGNTVTFRYHDKTNGQEKRETVSVEEFIGRLISHIPDGQFKMIRHYGVYARRSKKIAKQKISIWQQEMQRKIVQIKRYLTRRKWNQRIKDQTGKDPLVCSRCQCYYEYKGEVCLKDGTLVIKHALCRQSRACLEGMIEDLTGVKKEKGKEKSQSTPGKFPKETREERGRQICLFNVS